MVRESILNTYVNRNLEIVRCINKYLSDFNKPMSGLGRIKVKNISAFLNFAAKLVYKIIDIVEAFKVKILHGRAC